MRGTFFNVTNEKKNGISKKFLEKIKFFSFENWKKQKQKTTIIYLKTLKKMGKKYNTSE